MPFDPIATQRTSGQAYEAAAPIIAHELRFSAIVKDKRALLREARATLAADPRAKYKPDGHALYDAMMRKLFAQLDRHGVHSRITVVVRGSKPRKPRKPGVTFTKENPLGLVTRAGLGAVLNSEPGDIG